MNRRVFLAGAAMAAVAPGRAAAHEPSQVLNRFLAVMESQNWDEADAILAVNYAPLYPLSASSRSPME